ncbi:PREDICTED: ATG8-interacting protein 2-like [Camelina sativa]|uniref:ATG8-interacting protein 2-like n=1 Tax=Camelina sativa TaxID=90675 RepID=A0ABM0T781_CAMSA|nr:PREDICTED: ATG8-interacting protein 2-like [Camelina sativa]
MEVEELFDWELLHGSDTEPTDSITSEKKLVSSSVIGVGKILSDHFSVDTSHYGVLEPADSFRVNYGSDPLNQEEVWGDSEVRVSVFEALDEKHLKSEAAADGTGVEEPIEDSSKSWSESDSGGDELVSRIVNGEDEIVSHSRVVSTVEVGDVRCGDECSSRETVWWKVPFVLLKYSASRVDPVWSVSLAAAVIDFVLLGRRRLYDTKKNPQRFNLKVTIDDKKASQVMSQAARLNQVFTEVRRVPVVRPALPSPGAWPALSLR